MGWFEVGLNSGLFLFGIYIFLLTFNKKFREFFYGELMEDTILGNSGEFLFFPTDYHKNNMGTGETIGAIIALIGLQFLIFIGIVVCSTLLGYILLIPMLLAVVIGPIIYMIIQKRNNKLQMKKDLASIADDEQ